MNQKIKMNMYSIGTIHSPFKEASGTPIQPCMAEESNGYVEVFPEFREGLAGLDGFERIWLLYWCHLANESSLTVKPFLDKAEHGIFSVRAPSRPNPVGMSCVRLLSVDGCRLHVSGIDILDGTPLLDIKPYIVKFDSYSNIKCGWFDKGKKSEKAVADSRFEKSDASAHNTLK